MLKNSEEESLRQCLRLIEAQLGWGDGTGWTQYDFETLSEAIQERTQVRLSVTTLKRVWGKIRYDSAPTLTTLNTLARFAGYPDWRGFKQRQSEPTHYVYDADVAAEEPVVNYPIPDKEPDVSTRRLFRRYWLVLGLGLVVAGCLFIAFKEKSGAITINPNQFAFRANKMTTVGVPNSVVFNYDARAARTDSVFIVQTWDIRRKTLMAKDKHAHSAMYYYPGFFRTKLIVDGQVAKTHDLCINTDGWLGLVETEPVPLYFKKTDYLKNDRVEIDASTLQAYNLPLHPRAPKVRFFNQREMGDLMSDTFVFETSLKTDFKDGAGACQKVEVLIQCKDDIISIPLSVKTCIGEMNLYFCGKNISSRDADLSGFGCDLTQWTTLRVEAKNKQVAIYVNGTKAQSFTFPNQATGIVGLQYRFDGLGAVKDTWFQDKGGITRL
ncbi:hypothetical protein DYU11_18160 [Fibrisoma montanum]|uniref:Uncharacterized protein n=1 Tax=Fibrisoma montanum TaxID=2305895 RepID=A0A418M640_9BACT|nr:hypothetical protein [Fibrisoma montanum]RIV21332.1 hypothetical protein DYU11_18160 [Fibrisoma montanum]